MKCYNKSNPKKKGKRIMDMYGSSYPHGTARYRQVQLSNAIDPSIREAASMRADLRLRYG